MLKFRIILLVSVLASVRGAAFDGRIVGGHETTIEEHPYQVALIIDNFFFCAGSILSEKFILTAAHCTANLYLGGLSFKVRAGSTYKNKGGQLVDVAQIYESPSYSESTQDYDIAILKLSQPLDEASPITLPSRSYTNGESATVTGWGVESAGGSSPTYLMEATVRIITAASCRTGYSYPSEMITDKMICAAETGRDSCQGDSGGPLMVGDVQVGIVSWGYDCADPNYPGVYADVYALRSFIYDITGL